MSNEKVNYTQIMAQLQAELLLLQSVTPEDCIKYDIDAEAMIESVQNAMMAVVHIDGIEDIKGIT